jgi:AraC family cel operon transcriptional repressor
MRTELFRLETYIPREEAFHFAHKELDARTPPYLHRHDYFEWFMVDAGTLRHWTPDGEDVLTAGSMVFMRPHDAHALQALLAPCRIINVMTWPHTITALGRTYGEALQHCAFWSAQAKPEQHVLEGDELLRVRGMALALRDAPRSRLLIDQFILGLASVMQLATTGPIRTDGLPPWLTRTLRAARRPEVFRDGAAGIVRVSGRGHETVCRAFRRHLGQTPSQFVNALRMDYAARQLRTTDLPIDEIAQMAGLENLSYFYSTFRAHHGDTPKRYRQRRAADPVQPALEPGLK